MFIIEKCLNQTLVNLKKKNSGVVFTLYFIKQPIIKIIANTSDSISTDTKATEPDSVLCQ